jgi:hypothetical protein
MDAESVLMLLPAAAAGRAATGRLLYNQRFSKKMRLRSKFARAGSRAAKRMRAQALDLDFNNRGGARTFDHQMPIIRDGAATCVPRPPRGRGQYRSSTPQYICKMGFKPEEASLRVMSKDHGGSAAHARGCGMVVSDMIMSRQLQLAKQRQAISHTQPYDFHITNNMFDETQLPVAGYGRGVKRQRVLGASSQVTWKAPQSSVQDQKIIRAPTVLSRYTAATCVEAVGAPDDPFGLHPVHDDARPLAKFYGSLMSTDQHSVNVLTSKWVVQQQLAAGDNFFHAVCYCTQHKTGAVVEAVTKFLGLLSPSFCIAACLSYGNLAEDIEKNVRGILDEVLVVSDPAEMCYDETEERGVKFSKELMDQCYVCDAAQDQGEGDEDKVTRAVEKRRREAKELLDFFPLWGTTEKAEHLCLPGCCGPVSAGPAANRAASLDRACALVKLIIAPSITTPAANKYTKVDPVVRKVALMTNFLGLMRRAIATKTWQTGRLWRCRRERSCRLGCCDWDTKGREAAP